MNAWPLREGLPVHANVDRATLRQILLSGLDECLTYGKSLEQYVSYDKSVTAYFTDETTARGNVLVGADGIRSAVRRQRAPRAQTMVAEITAIYGRLPVSKAATLVPTEALADIVAIASDERKVFLGLGSVPFSDTT